MYHLFEQQICNLFRDLTDSRNLQLDMAGAVKRFRGVYGIDLETFPGWDEIDKTRLLANCIKHGEGPSCQKLRQLEPDLFKHPLYNEPGAPPRTFTERPLGGEGLYLTVSGFERKVDVIREFWHSLGECLVELDGAG